MQFRRPPDDTDEQNRLEALRSYHIDGSKSEAEFDHVARLAADLFQVPTALVSFVEADRQFFKARVGFDSCETSRDVSFCTHALASDEVLVVPDARLDPRFAENPLVTQEPFIRFYAGAPILTPNGLRLGSVCVIDTQPRPPLTIHQQGLLRSLSRIVTDHLEKRRLDAIRRGALSLAKATPDGIVCFDDQGAITFWSDAAERIFGYTVEEATGQPVSQIVPLEHRAAHEAGLARLVDGGQTRVVVKSVELKGQRRNGAIFPIELSLASWQDGDRLCFGSIIRDVSERQQERERLRQLTHFDRLTGLPNRSQFLERVDNALTSIGFFTIMKIGLDRFKTINGTLGMAAGDLVLAASARRIIDVAGASALVARLGADEFGILIDGTVDPAAISALAQRVLDCINEPFKIGGALCHLSASIGIVTCPELSNFDAADAALKAAMLALQHAKLMGGRQFAFFTAQLGEKAEKRLRLEEELRAALARNEFELFFQPQVVLPDARIVGAEALLRWRHPSRGVLSPALFIPVLETSDVVLEVGRWILNVSCAFAAEMAARGTPIRIGVNLFAAQLKDPSLIAEITAALKSTSLPHELLELEITETTVLQLDETIIAPLRHLRDLGVRIAFDDYGTGYASLSLLKRYPLTRLKIDREFVCDLGANSDDAIIIKAVLAMAASLNLDVIAEGIETAKQAKALTALGCSEAQGYFFGKPMPANEMAALLTSRTRQIIAA